MAQGLRLSIPNPLQIGRPLNIGVDPLRVNKSSLVEYRFVERTFLKSAANKGCCTKNGFLQTASRKRCFHKDRGGEADKKIIFLFKPAVLPPGATKRDLAKPGTTEFTSGKNGQAKGTETSFCRLKRASGEMTSGKKRIPDLQTRP